MRKPVILAALAGVSIACLGAPALAASVDYYIKIPDIDGESEARDGHKDWIELNSVTMAEGQGDADSAPAVRAGVRVASGDVTGDGKGKERPPLAVRRADGPGPAPAPSATGSAVRDVSSGVDPVPAGLLLPAVQKVRRAQASAAALPGCRVGARLGPVLIREGSAGRTGRILDATVSECASESISFNFTKIEWD
jgi:hypothetical protein